MTRDEAVQIITAALAQHFSPDDPNETAQHAQRIAITLDAIGLLHYAADRDLGAKLGHVGDEQPLQHSRTQPPEQLAAVATSNTSDQQLAASQADVSHWAQTRKRT